MDVLRNAQRIHNKLLKRIAKAEWVLYEGAGITVRVEAIRGQTQPASISGAGSLQVGKQFVDWLIVTDEFVTDAGNRVTPIEGATITPESGDGVFEVVTGPSGQCYKPADGRKMRIRIHTDELIERTE
jgi:hypothetical protein